MTTPHLAATTLRSAAELPDQAGRTAIITGANSGIGRAAAAALTARGAHVALAVRSLEKGRRAAAEIGGSTEVRELDLASLASVRAFAAGWDRPVDVLINNAGIMVPPPSRTADGFELQLGTNHLGHFALTNLLLDRVTDRVVTVSSLVHRIGRIDFGDLNWERRSHRRWSAYAQSKLANLLFTLELQRRLAEAGSAVRATCAHPGYASTNLQSHSDSAVGGIVMQIGNRLVGQTEQAGALPTLFAAVADIPGGSFAGPSRAGGVRGPAGLCGRSRAAFDEDVARRLWDVSARLTGVDFPLATAPAAG